MCLANKSYMRNAGCEGIEPPRLKLQLEFRLDSNHLFPLNSGLIYTECTFLDYVFLLLQDRSQCLG